jgi:hypothetical protein
MIINIESDFQEKHFITYLKQFSNINVSKIHCSNDKTIITMTDSYVYEIPLDRWFNIQNKVTRFKSNELTIQ